MRLFFRSLILFSIFFLFFGEIVSRVFHISTDAGKTYKNKNGNINYFPNQEGYRDGGKIKWYINALGYPGKNLPDSYHDLVLLIGDSYIQNFMNPDSCRQREFLSVLKPELNFLEVSIAGLNFLGYFEYSKHLDSLNPLAKVIYVSTKDFLTNIENGKKMDGYRVNLDSGILHYPKFKGSVVKDFIYNFKFIYYLYRKNIQLFSRSNEVKSNLEDENTVNPKYFKFSDDDYQQIRTLLQFIKTNYDCKNTYLVFHPNSDEKLISLTRKEGFNVREIFKEKNDNWKTQNHGHWNCSAHEKIAIQVSLFLNENGY